MKKTIKTLYIDTETTGLNPKKNAMIQLAGTIEVGGKKKEDFNFNIAPYANAIIEDEALKINGIKRVDLLKFSAPHQVYRKFTTLLKKYVDPYNPADKFHIVGYKINFDTNFLREFFIQNNDKYYGSLFYNNTIDVSDIYSLLLRSHRHELKDFKLGTVYSHVTKRAIPKDLHDAMADIKYTRDLYKRALKKIYQ